jgi:hypothetical protein
LLKPVTATAERGQVGNVRVGSRQDRYWLQHKVESTPAVSTCFAESSDQMSDPDCGALGG